MEAKKRIFLAAGGMPLVVGVEDTEHLVSTEPTATNPMEVKAAALHNMVASEETCMGQLAYQRYSLVLEVEREEVSTVVLITEELEEMEAGLCT